MNESRSSQEFDYESIPPGYYDLVHDRNYGMQSFWHQNKFHEVLSSFSFKQAHLNLDIACGPGTFLGQYSESKSRIGIDLARNQIEYAKIRYGSRDDLKFEVNEINDLSVHADVVTMIEFIEHITSKAFKEILGDLSRSSLPGHELVITTPNYSGPWPLLEIFVGIFARGLKYDQQHICKYNKRSLRKLLEENGYKVNEIYGIQGIASFFAILNWRIAWTIARFEKKFVKYWGFQIICIAQKVENHEI